MIITHLFKPLSALKDEELMQRVSSKDDDRAYDELYHRHARRLMGFFFRQTGGNETLAADLTQDAFMRVWTARDKFQVSEEASDNDIIDQLDQQTFDQTLKRLLEKMPPESRLLFSLRFEEELTVPQIAVVMAVPEGTVKSRLHILTQTLKQILKSS